MAKYGRGLICLSLTDKQAKKLNLSLMSPVNKSRNQTAFTISIEQEGVLQQVSLQKIGILLLKRQSKVTLKKMKLFHQDIFFQLLQKKAVFWSEQDIQKVQ